MKINIVIKATALLLFCLTLFSCQPSKQEIWINEDDSYKLEITYELGGMADMLKMMFTDSTGNSAKSLSKETGTEDTIMYVSDMIPDSIKEQLSHPEILGKMELAMHLDYDNEDGQIVFKLDLDNGKQTTDFENLLKELESFKTADPTMGMLKGDDGSMFLQHELDKKLNVIRIPSSFSYDELADEDLEMVEMLRMKVAEEGPEALEDPQIKMVMEMIFGGETQTIVHTPRDIWFTNDPDAVVEKRKVTFTNNYLEDILSWKTEKPNDIIIKLKD